MATILEHWQWPLGAAIALACILGYRRFVRKAQAYTSRVKKELEEYVKQPTPVPAALPIPPRNPSDTATLAAEKQLIWQKIHEYPLAHNQQVDILVSQLAEARIVARFLEAYFLILGSQHAFLRRLNSQTGSGTMSRATSETFLADLAVANKSVAQAKHDFNQWLAFLVSQGFVNVGIDSISITTGGQDFLVWITRRQLPERVYEGI